VTVALGMTLYNNARFLPEALESILSQTYSDFHLVMLDDGSRDETPEIARNYATRDARIRYERHEERQGMIAAWRRAFELACGDGAAVGYFAWTSDHDRWHPEWLRTLVECLDRHQEVVLAYPLSRRVDGEGRIIDKPLRTFDTAGISDLGERWSRLCHDGIGAGDMVYGLIRVPALISAGVFRDVLRPDRLLIAELALRGQFRQVPQILWYRRRLGIPSVDRQRATLFGGHRAPRTIGLPPAVQHADALYANYVRRFDSGLGVTRATLIRMIARYVVGYSVRHFRKSALRHRWGVAVEGLFWLKKHLVRTYHVTVYELLVSTKAMRGRARRFIRRSVFRVAVLPKHVRRLFRWSVFKVLVFTKRIGLRP
jgi:glycosyltransferase involved in cell wall biosynthesis